MKFQLIAAVALGVASLSPALAGSKFDGTWAVEVVSHRGQCTNYNLKVALGDGRVTNLKLAIPVGGTVQEVDGSAAQPTGGVDARGRVAVSLTEGAGVMSVTGALNGRSGSGSWVAQGGECAGAWHALRRS